MTASSVGASPPASLPLYPEFPVRIITKFSDVIFWIADNAEFNTNNLLIINNRNCLQQGDPTCSFSRTARCPLDCGFLCVYKEIGRMTCKTSDPENVRNSAGRG